MSDRSILKWFKHRSLLHLGERSYGIYLVHILCIQASERVFRPGSGSWPISFLALLLAILLSVMMAEGLYRTIERPLVNFGRRQSERIKSAKNRTAV